MEVDEIVLNRTRNKNKFTHSYAIIHKKTEKDSVSLSFINQY
jgi:hypothetical protein